MNVFFRIVLFCFLSIACPAVMAQYGTTPQIINYTKLEYGASNQNWSIDQDSLGNIFVANNKGLLVYNGAWNLYELPGQQIVRSVACDKERVYTGGFGEFGYWQKELLGYYIYHSLTPKINYPQFSKEEIWKITKMGDRIYFQSFSTIYVLENENITVIKCPINIMYAFCVHNHLYVQLLKKGLYELRGKDFFPISNLSVFQNDEIITCVEGEKNSVIVGTVHNGLYQVSEKDVKPFANEIQETLKTAQINAAIRLTDTSFAIGTIQKGVYVISVRGTVLEQFDKKNGLQNNTVLSLKKDAIGNLWVGMDRGLDQIVLQSPLRFFKEVNGDIGSVYAAALYKGVLYIGSNDGLYRYDPIRGFVNIGGINWQVWSLNIINDQLFCSHNSGVIVLNQNGIVERIATSGGWSIKKLTSHPDIALQGSYIGLSSFKKGADGFFHFNQKIKGLETMPISDWEEDNHGNIWLKHAYKGLSRIKLNANYDSVINITPITQKDGIYPEIQQNLGYWSGNIYAISKDGIRIWNYGKSQFEKANNLFNLSGRFSQIKRVFAMPDHSFWVVNEDNKVIYITPKGKQLPFYLKDFSLVGGYENIIAIDSSHRILCGESGFALFSANQVGKANDRNPVISSVFINVGDSILPIQTMAKMKNDKWEIPYYNRTLKIVVGNTIFDHLVQYRFKLDRNGENGFWSEWQSETSKVYTDLPAGDYKVSVQTNFSTHPAIFEFTILPPWYWSWWSKLIYLCAFGVLIYISYKSVEKKHLKQLRHKQLEMEKQLSMQKMQHEHELLLLKKEKLEEEVQFKSEDLANSANELIKRKKLLSKLHTEIAKQTENKENKEKIPSSLRKLSRELERQIKLDKDETKLFEHGFNSVHDHFFGKLLSQYPNLTPQDLKLAAYLRMNLGSKEIAPLLNITVRGVELKRYRLRKKMSLDESVNLNEFMMTYA